MKLNLPDINTDPELWLSVLADNELDATHRAQLSRYLDDHPELWRDCAVALMDQQVVASQLTHAPAPISGISTAGLSKTVSKTSQLKRSVPVTQRPMSLVAVAALLVALAGGLVIGEIRHNTNDQHLRTALTESNDNARLLSELLIAREPTDPDHSLYHLYPYSPLMIEIENTDDRAVFLTDRPVSDAMLESFLAAGHQVEINPYSPRLQTGWLKSLKNPVLAVEVNKSNAHLIVQGDIQ